MNSFPTQVKTLIRRLCRAFNQPIPFEAEMNCSILQQKAAAAAGDAGAGAAGGVAAAAASAASSNHNSKGERFDLYHVTTSRKIALLL